MIGPEAAFRWTLYLLLSLWPVSVYLGARLLGAGRGAAGAWVIMPLLEQRSWASENDVLTNTPLANGYGAGRVLAWLASGQLLDRGRLPVLTLFCAIGLVLAVRCCRRDDNARVLLVTLAVCRGGAVERIPVRGLNAECIATVVDHVRALRFHERSDRPAG